MTAERAAMFAASRCDSATSGDRRSSGDVCPIAQAMTSAATNGRSGAHNRPMPAPVVTAQARTSGKP